MRRHRDMCERAAPDDDCTCFDPPPRPASPGLLRKALLSEGWLPPRPETGVPCFVMADDGRVCGRPATWQVPGARSAPTCASCVQDAVAGTGADPSRLFEPLDPAWEPPPEWRGMGMACREDAEHGPHEWGPYGWRCHGASAAHESTVRNAGFWEGWAEAARWLREDADPQESGTALAAEMETRLPGADKETDR